MRTVTPLTVDKHLCRIGEEGKSTKSNKDSKIPLRVGGRLMLTLTTPLKTVSPLWRIPFYTE